MTSPAGDEGLRTATAVEEGIRRWRGIARVELVGNLLFVSRTDQTAMVIARECVAEGSFDDFASDCQRRWQADVDGRVNPDTSPQR